MAQRAEGFIQVLPQSTGEKVWVEQISDGTSTLDVQHVSLGIDLVLQDNATLTATGSAVVYVGANNEVNVVTHIKGTVSGTTPVLVTSIQDLAPGDLTTVVNQPVTGANITATAALQQITHEPNSGYVLVKWTITGTTPSFGGAYISVSTKTTSLVQPNVGTKANVSASASSVTILSANSARKRWMVFNDSSVNLYLDLTGGTASTSSYSVKVAPGQLYEDTQPVVPGAVTGIWDSATGNARVTELV
jgi:hypothetical protein